MSNIKQHFFFILPLVALLFGLESLILINRAIISNEDKLLQNYAIVIASKQNLTLEFISQNIPEASSIEPIDPSFVLDKIRPNMNNDDFENIKKGLSLYYALKLSSFPDEKRLAKIDTTLSKIPGVIRTESFSKTHNQTSKLLYFIKLSVQIFALLIAVLSVLLMISQIRIWHFEHNKRVQIMTYLGASMWMKNKFLIKSVLGDSIFASCLSIGGVLYFSTTSASMQVIEALGVRNDIFYFFEDYAFLLLASVVISLFSAIIAIFLQRKV